MTHSTPWNAEVYRRFERERAQPFHDLLAGLEPVVGARVVDLGCGTAELTRVLHQRTGARSTLGIDSSAAMLGEAPSAPGLELRQEDIRTFAPSEAFDVVFSNAALQWLPDHEALFERLAAWVAPGGQFAVQVPANQHHLSHVLAAKLAVEEHGVEKRAPSVLAPDAYSVLLHHVGFEQPRVSLNVYLHLLPGPESVLEWVDGTLLNAYRKRLGPDAFPSFRERYGDELLAALPEERPFPFTFPRILMWARRPR